MFIPSNVPILLLPFLVIIEIISHIAKIFSLAIRLFANMMSGHVLLHILTGFILDLAKKNLLFIFFPIILIVSIIILEYGITFLQGYVFLTLLAIYFEEHFGFAQEERSIILNLVSANGKMYSLTNSICLLRSSPYLIYMGKNFFFLVKTDEKMVVLNEKNFGLTH